MNLIQGDVKQIPLRDNSVDLIVTSPPYFGLRNYDSGDTQIGAESDLRGFLDAMLAATNEMARVIKSSGSIFVNLGDKHEGSGGHNNANLGASPDRGPSRYLSRGNSGIPNQSLMGIPWRYANEVVDKLSLILRAEIIWSKRNAMPEPTRNRVQRSHEHFFHFTTSNDYFSGADELRPRATGTELGRIPGSVWEINTEGLHIPEGVLNYYGFPKHFAAFPQEWPYRLIRGWSPNGICLACDAGRFPVIDRAIDSPNPSPHAPDSNNGQGASTLRGKFRSAIIGYACDCTPSTDHAGTVGRKREGQRYAEVSGRDAHTHGGVGDLPRTGPWREYHFEGWTPPPTRPAVVLDPFSGTGTTALVARELGRIGVGIDLSYNYCRLARWRIEESGHARKTREKVAITEQGDLFG